MEKPVREAARLLQGWLKTAIRGHVERELVDDVLAVMQADRQQNELIGALMSDAPRTQFLGWRVHRVLRLTRCSGRLHKLCFEHSLTPGFETLRWYGCNNPTLEPVWVR